MAVFGLTGSLASGKTTVLKLLKDKGAQVFYADRKVHRYYRDKSGPVYQAIAALFPETLDNAVISRKKLAGTVFSEPKKLKKLEAIVHPVVIRELAEWINKARQSRRVQIAEVPLLFEKKLSRYFEGVILVKAKQRILIQRIIKKYRLSRKAAVERLALFKKVEDKIKKADFIIDNNSGFKNLKKEVDLLWKRITQK